MPESLPQKPPKSPKDFMDQHPLWKWMDGYLEDRPTQPWTLFD